MPAGAEFWPSSDAEWATRLATQEVGEAATIERFVAARARIAWQRISGRRLDLERALEKHYPGAFFGWMIILFSLIAGILTDQIGDSKRVNLLALPFVAIIVWNLLMYVWLFFLRPVLGLFGLKGWGQRWLTGMLSGAPSVARDQQIKDMLSLRGRCMADWASLSLPVATVRVSRVLHLSAAMLAIGLVIAIYSRAFYTEYHVGWESTLLDASDISVVLAAVFGWLPMTFGLATPDLSVVEQMSFSAGGGLVGARPWLHLMASLAIMLVVLPRLALVAFASFRLRLLERRFPIDLTQAYFQRLAAKHSRHAGEFIAIPYAKTIGPSAAIILSRIVQDVFGSGSSIRVLDTVPFGGEDDFPKVLSNSPDSIHLLLFDLASTPESENHGVFLKAVKAAASPSRLVIALVDSNEFSTRFGGAGDRLEQRTKLWQQFLADCDVPCVVGGLVDDGIEDLSRNLELALVQTEGGRYE